MGLQVSSDRDKGNQYLLVPPHGTQGSRPEEPVKGLSWERLAHRVSHSGAVPGMDPAHSLSVVQMWLKLQIAHPAEGLGAGYAPAVSTQVSCFYAGGLRPDVPGETLVRWP